MQDRLKEELDRLHERAANCHPRDMTGYFMAQQAIAWAMDPTMAMSPSELMARPRRAPEASVSGPLLSPDSD